MLIDLDEFKSRLKSFGLPVYRDMAPKNQEYPYYIYTFVGAINVNAGGNHVNTFNEYQVSLFTTGTEKELLPFKKGFKDVPYSNFYGQQGDENDETVTNFYTYVRVPDNE